MHLHGEVRGLLAAISQSESGNHVALSGDAHSGAPSQSALMVDFLPQVILYTLHLIVLRVALHLLHDALDLLQLEVHDIVHDALCEGHMLFELVEIERSLRSEGIVDIRVEVDGEKTARVVGTERYLATGIGRDGAEAQVGIAVGDALTDDGIPEEHSGFGALPCIVHDFGP